MGLLQVLKLPSRSAAPSASAGPLAATLAPVSSPQAPPSVVRLVIHAPVPMEPRQKQSFTVMAEYSDGKLRDYTSQAAWSSSNDKLLAFVSGNAAQAGFDDGIVTITAAVPGGKPSDSAKVAIHARLVKITVLPASPLLEIGQTEPLRAIAEYADGRSEDVSPSVTWSSEKPALADITSSVGDCLAKKAGAVNVWAESADGQVQGYTKVTVVAAGKTPKLTAVDIQPRSPDLKDGQPLQFEAIGIYADKSRHDITRKVEWRSSKREVLVVGKDTGLAEPRMSWGTAEVAAVDLATGLYQSTLVYVQTPSVVGLSIDPSPIRIAFGSAVAVKVTATLQGGRTMDVTEVVKWNPSVPDIAAPGNNGHTMGSVAAGTTTFEVIEPGSGIAEAVDVTVLPPVLVDIFLVPVSAQTIRVGGTIGCMAFGVFSDQQRRELKKPVWSVTPNGVLDIDQTGLATARKAGKAVIRIEEGGTDVGKEVEVEVLP